MTELSAGLCLIQVNARRYTNLALHELVWRNRSSRRFSRSEWVLLPSTSQRPALYRRRANVTQTFDLGDTVRLRSGGPVMTINEKSQGGGFVCVWLATNEVEHRMFKAEALEAASRSASSAITDEEGIGPDE
jgi:uncharacterized protein YodC (DUF2158 family)